jgi:putative hydroxymethylpyrimidine transport system substrate-binding protein
MPRRLLIVLALALVPAGCGGSSSGGSATGAHHPQSASLVLDFTPNAVHVGIYTAIAHHFDTRAGIRLHVEIPGASTDAISELESGRVDYAVLDIHDLAIADAKGADLRAIMPIVQRPLAAVIAAPGITSPRQLAGHTVGVTGDPSDLAVLRSEVLGSGGDPSKVHTIVIGFNAVADLISGRVSAATAFWNDEGVTVRRHDPGFHVFRVDDYGAPSYPELVVCATASSLHRDPRRATDLVRALRAGYGYAVAHPALGANALETQVSGLDPALVSAELPGLIQAFTGPGHRVGVFNFPLLHRWARWEQRFGIVSRVPDVRALFDPPPS